MHHPTLEREEGKTGAGPLPGSCLRQSKPRQSHGTLRALWSLGCGQAEGGHSSSAGTCTEWTVLADTSSQDR